MIYRLIVIVPLLVVAFADDAAKFTDGTVENKEVIVNASTWRAIIGDICQLGQLPRPISTSNLEYLECVHTPEQANRDDVGVWLVQKCSAGTQFNPLQSQCQPTRHVRRQQSNYCNSNPSGCSGSSGYQVQPQQTSYQCSCQPPAPPQSSCMCQSPQVYQPQPAPQPQQQSNCGCQQQPSCPCAPQQQVVQPMPCSLASGGTSNAQPGGICSWMIDPLVAHPSQKNCFLQCQPAPYNEYCGRWQTMPCARYTIFDARLQVCTWDPSAQPGQLPPGGQQQQPQSSSSCGCSTGTNIGQCGSNYQCPGMSQCQISQPTPQSSGCSSCCYFGLIKAR